MEMRRQLGRSSGGQRWKVLGALGAQAEEQPLHINQHMPSSLCKRKDGVCCFIFEDRFFTSLSHELSYPEWIKFPRILTGSRSQ